MSQVRSLGTVLGASMTMLANTRKAQQQAETNRAQYEISQQQAALRRDEVTAQQQADALSRATQLAHNTGATQARAASAGLLPYDGSAAAIASGQTQEAAAAQEVANSRYQAQRQAIVPSLLEPDGTTMALLRSGRAFGSMVNGLLD